VSRTVFEAAAGAKSVPEIAYQTVLQAVHRRDS